MEQAIGILKLAYEATTEISGELYVTRSYIILRTQSLVNYYEHLYMGLGDIQDNALKIRDALLSALKHHFSGIEAKDAFSLATFLDPRFKNKCFSLSRSAVIQAELEMEGQHLPFQSDTGGTTDETPTPLRRAKSVLWPDFDYHAASGTMDQNPMKEEIGRYITLPVLDQCKNPAGWRETIGKGLLPCMYEQAKCYLAIPATSVPSKRVFNTVGLAISKKRMRKKRKKMRTLMKMLPCLSSYMRTYLKSESYAFLE